jgi:hypothetical protein
MKPKHVVKLVGAAMAALVAVAMMAPMAQADTPATGYENFAGCPSENEVPYVTSCIRSVVKSGNFKMGNKNVTIEKPIVISGGTDEELNNLVANSKGGMPPVNQKVPGGIIGLTGLTWLVEFFGSEALTLYAATELAGQPKVNDLEHLELPIKVHLIHSVLGKNCYVGSVSNPIKLKLNISGEAESVFFDALNVLHLTGLHYSDKTFSAPGASGCTLTLFGFIPVSINGLVNLQSGLPAASGNETNQVLDIEIAGEELVYP